MSCLCLCSCASKSWYPLTQYPVISNCLSVVVKASASSGGVGFKSQPWYSGGYGIRCLMYFGLYWTYLWNQYWNTCACELFRTRRKWICAFVTLTYSGLLVKVEGITLEDWCVADWYWELFVVLSWTCRRCRWTWWRKVPHTWLWWLWTCHWPLLSSQEVSYVTQRWCLFSDRLHHHMSWVMWGKHNFIYLCMTIEGESCEANLGCLCVTIYITTEVSYLK